MEVTVNVGRDKVIRNCLRYKKSLHKVVSLNWGIDAYILPNHRPDFEHLFSDMHNFFLKMYFAEA